MRVTGADVCSRPTKILKYLVWVKTIPCSSVLREHCNHSKEIAFESSYCSSLIGQLGPHVLTLRAPQDAKQVDPVNVTPVTSSTLRHSDESARRVREQVRTSIGHVCSFKDTGIVEISIVLHPAVR